VNGRASAPGRPSPTRRRRAGRISSGESTDAGAAAGPLTKEAAGGGATLSRPSEAPRGFCREGDAARPHINPPGNDEASGANPRLRSVAAATCAQPGVLGPLARLRLNSAPLARLNRCPARSNRTARATDETKAYGRAPLPRASVLLTRTGPTRAASRRASRRQARQPGRRLASCLQSCRVFEATVLHTLHGC